MLEKSLTDRNLNHGARRSSEHSKGRRREVLPDGGQ
jgi:hypothetical protein